MDIRLEKTMSIFTPDKEVESIVKAVIVRIDPVQDLRGISSPMHARKRRCTRCN